MQHIVYFKWWQVNSLSDDSSCNGVKESMLETSKSKDILREKYYEGDKYTKDTEIPAPDIIKGHASDPLKKYLNKARPAIVVSSYQEPKDNVSGIHKLLDSLIQPMSALEISEDKLKFKAQDFIEEGLLNFDINAKYNVQEVSPIKEATSIFNKIQSKGQGLQYFVGKHSLLRTNTDYYHIDRKFVSLQSEELDKLLALKHLVEKGGSRKSGRTQKEIMNEKESRAKEAMKIYSRLLNRVRYFSLSNYVFLYHDTMAEYVKSYYHVMEKASTTSLQQEKKKLLEMIERGLTDEAISEELVYLFIDYSNKMYLELYYGKYR